MYISIKPSKRQLSHLIGVCCLSILFLLLLFIIVIVVDSLVDGLHCERSKLPLQHLFIAICFELSDHLTNLLRNSSGRFHSARERERKQARQRKETSSSLAIARRRAAVSKWDKLIALIMLKNLSSTAALSSYIVRNVLQFY